MELANPKQIPELNLIQDVSLNGVKVLLAEDNELNAYSAESAHPFRRNGAPFRFKLSSAQIVN